MTNILSLRSRRFHGLYALLTGDANVPSHLPRNLLDHLAKDMGVPETASQDRAIRNLHFCSKLGRP